MAQNRRLTTDQDFKEAMDRQAPVRVFKNDHIVDTGPLLPASTIPRLWCRHGSAS
ncbi:hypothetical protein SAMN02799616_00802 [Paenibacillus sp. UNC499MF]|nr:hypothetical protein SAMN02799616_00802 [Paenibacillus sp. UNC499MF]